VSFLLRHPLLVGIGLGISDLMLIIWWRFQSDIVGRHLAVRVRNERFQGFCICHDKLFSWYSIGNGTFFVFHTRARFWSVHPVDQPDKSGDGRKKAEYQDGANAVACYALSRVDLTNGLIKSDRWVRPLFVLGRRPIFGDDRIFWLLHKSTCLLKKTCFWDQGH
jgi:hypothetical protein